MASKADRSEEDLHCVGGWDTSVVSKTERPGPGLIPFCCSSPISKKRMRFPFALLLFVWFRGNYISLRKDVTDFNYLRNKQLPPACGRVSYIIQEKSPKSQFCCSMTAPHTLWCTPHCLHCWGPSNYMENGPEFPMLSAWLSAWQGTWQVSHLGRRKTCHPFASCLLEQGLCSPARCWPPSHPHEADGSCEHLRTLTHGWHFMKCMRKRPAHHSSVHINFSFDCYRFDFFSCWISYYFPIFIENQHFRRNSKFLMPLALAQ